MAHRSPAFWLAVVLAIGAIGWALRERSRATAVAATLVEARTQLARSESERQRAAEQLARAKVTAAAADRMAAPKGRAATDLAFEEGLDAWLNRVDRLRAFLAASPDRSIPDLALITPDDWLDAARGPTLETEADFRAALSQLRLAARKKTGPLIQEALKQAMAANHGEAPASVDDLRAYLKPGTDPRILQDFALNPSGQLPGLALMGGGRVVLVEQPVDELWDLTRFYGSDGSSGIRGSTEASAATRQLAAATDAYQKTYGAAPANVQQLVPFLTGGTANLPLIEELFRAKHAKLPGG